MVKVYLVISAEGLEDRLVLLKCQNQAQEVFNAYQEDFNMNIVIIGDYFSIEYSWSLCFKHNLTGTIDQSVHIICIKTGLLC